MCLHPDGAGGRGNLLFRPVDLPTGTPRSFHFRLMLLSLELSLVSFSAPTECSGVELGGGVPSTLNQCLLSAHWDRPSRNRAPSNHTHLSAGGGAEGKGGVVAVVFSPAWRRHYEVLIHQVQEMVKICLPAASPSPPPRPHSGVGTERSRLQHRLVGKSWILQDQSWVMSYMAGLDSSFLASLTSCLPLH